MLLERGLEREGNRSVFWKGQDQDLGGHRLALGGMGNGSAGFSITITMGTRTLV